MPFYLFRHFGLLTLTFLVFSACSTKLETETPLWHDIERQIRYQPEDDGFVIKNGERRFNRALYGSNSGFRVETGDLPEFALYMPRLGGTIRLGLITPASSKWLIEADDITAKYTPGKMSYWIKDALLGKGALHIEVLALYEEEGIIFRTRLEDAPYNVQLFWMYGGASDERFNREGDIGADPESVFYLIAENCKNNSYQLNGSAFEVNYLPKDRRFEGKTKRMGGVTPPKGRIKTVDAATQSNPGDCFSSSSTDSPAIAGTTANSNDWQYFSIYNANRDFSYTYPQLESAFQNADEARQKIANRITIQTPNEYLNNLGGVLSMAADAIWETPAYRHGAIAWRQPLNGWRGAYVADPLGWHDRARTHLRAYGQSQLTEPPAGPSVPDTSRNFARQTEEIGTAIFTSGYICRDPGGERLRAHHYDMNQVYIDQLLRHFQWTGDLNFIKEMWPIVERHLAWEKRNFDTDGDALYDSYCSFWASDAVQYSGGGVAHASAYHYYSNTKAAFLAELIGKNPVPYQEEAQRIKQALNTELWLPEQGCYAEFKDLLGKELLHTSPGLWTIYHTIDSEVPDLFQNWQLLQYIDQEIPHIPIRAEGLPRDDLYTLSTTNWLPYTWSVNNVALAENLHAALAYWQGGRNEEAFLLWFSNLMESMYLGASPGSIQQLSFYDAIRGELYRDFADPIGMTARSLVEGLFGIQPDLLNKKLSIRPGFPDAWPMASIEIPDLTYQYERTEEKDHYSFSTRFGEPLELDLEVKARKASIEKVLVNGQEAGWQVKPEAVGHPLIQIKCPAGTDFEIDISWGREIVDTPDQELIAVVGESLEIKTEKATILEVFDPQSVFSDYQIKDRSLNGEIGQATRQKTVFLKLKQKELSWWQPIQVSVKNPVEIIPLDRQDKESIAFRVVNNQKTSLRGQLFLGAPSEEPIKSVTLGPKETSVAIYYSSEALFCGTNLIRFESENLAPLEKNIINWNLKNREEVAFESVDLSTFFNEQVSNIFRQSYLSPRPEGPTVQLPQHGIGNWCYPNIEVNIDDSGLRAISGGAGQFVALENIVFQTPGAADSDNIVFTSQWDNYPKEVEIPLHGRSTHAYFLLAGSTNPMQSRMVNGQLEVRYKDGTSTVLDLRNPENWWPIEQDYYLDGYAFYSNSPKPPRVHLKTGKIHIDFSEYINIKGYSETGIDGGAATILDLPLDPSKELEKLRLRTLSNDVVIGLMGVSLSRN